MNWTKKSPTEPGYYWVAERLNEAITKKHIVECLGPDSILMFGTEGEFSSDEFTYFMGPIETPWTPRPDITKYIIDKCNEAGLNAVSFQEKDGVQIYCNYATFDKKPDIKIDNNKNLFYVMGNVSVQFFERDLDEKLQIFIDLYKD